MKYWKNGIVAGSLGLLVMVAASCGSDDATPPQLSVDVFGFGPDFEGGTSFVSGLPNFDGAETAVFKLTQPYDGRVLGSEGFPVGSGSADIPQESFGENLRLDMEILDPMGEPVASGATPVFTFVPGDDRKNFRLQVARVNEFVPVGSIIAVDGTRQFTQTRFDYRGQSDGEWRGRIGHAATTTLDDRVLVVGGGQTGVSPSPTGYPEFSAIHDDIQLFDARSGYLTNLAYDDASDSAVSEDRLVEPVAHATVTHIGGDRYIVAGGFTLRAGTVRPSNTIQLIDLTAPTGQRVSRLVGNDQSSQVLRKARGMHTASYRPADNTIVIAGGIGPAGEDDIVDLFEVIDLDTNTVSETYAMQEARVGHTSVTMEDGATVWLIGGRNSTGVLASTETVNGTASAGAADMKVGRFAHQTIPITASGGSLLLTVGGYVDTDGAATGNYEISGLGRGFLSASGWALNSPRGNPSVVELPQSGDVIVIGGRDANADVLEAERLDFTELAASNPYEVQSGGTAESARFNPSAHVASNGRIVLIGGFGVFEGTRLALDNIEYYNAWDPVGAGVQILE